MEEPRQRSPRRVEKPRRRRTRALVARVIPGVEDYNNRILDPDGFYLPNGPRDARQFATSSRRAHFFVNELEILETSRGELLLQTVRSHDQYSTTIYGLDDRYRGIKNGRRIVFVGYDDLEELGHHDGDIVDLVSTMDGTERRGYSFRIVAYPIARGTCATYFPEANVLVPLDSTADISNTPTSKSIIVRLESPRAVSERPAAPAAR